MQLQSKEWYPASYTPDVQAHPPLATFGNVASAPPSIIRAEVLTLIQSQVSGTENSTKRGRYHKLGKPGHRAINCSELTTFARKSRLSTSSGSLVQDRSDKHKSWSTIPQLPGTIYR
jgi:hypothetical protein